MEIYALEVGNKVRLELYTGDNAQLLGTYSSLSLPSFNYFTYVFVF